MSDPVISLEGVGKRYVKYDDAPALLSRALRRGHQSRRSELWAVRGVDALVQPGECLGVVGRNGSGKSTLLQMLAGVTAPTEGRVAVRGRIAPLVSVGVGFHPELTGRENVYVNGTILGLTRPEIDARFDAIVAFSGIESFIDTPVKFYSSGMYVRLGFAVAVEATPDVLLVDEVLAVGDIAFQLRCFRRMAEIRESGSTIVVVTHNLNALRQLADRAMVLHDGTMRYDGEVDEGIGLYHELIGEHADPDAGDVRSGARVESGTASIDSVTILDRDGSSGSHVRSGDEITLRVTVTFHRAVARPMVGFAIIAGNGSNVYSDTSVRKDLPAAPEGALRTYDIRVRLPLATGSYVARVGVHRIDDDDYTMTQLNEARPVSFFVSSRLGIGGIVDLEAEFAESSD